MMSAFGKHPRFVIKEQQPLNAGPPLHMLPETFVTPQELFYVRNHGTVPSVHPAHYRLGVGGLVMRQLSLSLPTLHALPRREVCAALQCAGNRRSELAAVEPIPGELPWGAEAVGNAVWAGAALRDVLEAAGVLPGARHVAFSGLDEVERQGRRFGFGGSIPIEKALSDEALLAYEMNGAALEPLHGYPLRVLVPGYIGARSVKWLAEITVQDEPSDNYFQAHAYKLFPPQARAATVDWSAGTMLGELNLNAVICTPGHGARLTAGQHSLAGYALAYGERPVAAVEVSRDGGATWAAAELSSEAQQWSWRLWRAKLHLEPGQHQLVVRAHDTAGNTQPADLAGRWNFKGYMNNAWHRVEVIVSE
jgi:sulfite oxidase